MKYNLNNDIKSLYMSMKTYGCESNVTVLVNYTNIYVVICLNTTEEKVKVWPDELGKGFDEYVKLQQEHVVYDFMCTYVRRMRPDKRWKKMMTLNPGWPFICLFTPSDIAYVLAVIKNGQEMWDQAKNPSASPEKKLRPLFSSGEGRKKESGISMWNKEGLEFYYTVEKNWKKLYNDKAKFSVLINGWETWEPKDKNKKNALRTYWSNEEEDMSSEKTGTQKKAWWEQEDEGYNTDSNVNTEFQWEDKTKRIIKERMGVVNEDTDNEDGIEGEDDNNYEEDGEKRNEDDEDNDDDDNKGHNKRHFKRNKR
jgi:hypothetical protein